MGIECFISAQALELHREYAFALQTKKTMCASRKAAAAIENEIRAHALYFSSFRHERSRSQRIKEGYRSENRFCFLLSEYAKNLRFGFLYIYPIARHPYVGYGVEERNIDRAVLAIDLCEHAYFLDYGFDFSAYLSAALSHLDFSRLK